MKRSPGAAEAHPGITLAERLNAAQISASGLARHLAIPVNRVTQILNGQRGITGDTALRLGRFFGTPAEFWLNLQKIYELQVAEFENGDTIRDSVRTLEQLAQDKTPEQTSLFTRDRAA